MLGEDTQFACFKAVDGEGDVNGVSTVERLQATPILLGDSGCNISVLLKCLSQVCELCLITN